MNLRKKIIFIILLIVISFFYNYHKILNKDAYSIHQWRQADCLSLTMSYFEHNASFFKPSIFWIGRNKDTQTISEFPLIYFSVAQIWKLTGKKIFIFRIIDTFIVLLGLFYLFLLFYEILGDFFWAAFVPLLLFTSPVLVYYTNNFLMNAPAFGLVLIAWYYFWKFYKTEENKYLLISAILFLIAGLLKITSLLSFTALYGIYIISLLNFKFLKEIKVSKKKFFVIFTFSAVFILVFLWYLYARIFNSHHLHGIFLQGIFPIWDLARINIRENANSLYNVLFPSFFYPVALTFVLFSVSLYLLNFKKSNKFLYLLNLLTFIGAIVFIILWYKAFTVHDYYLLNLLIIIPLSFVSILLYIKQNFNNLFINKNIKILSALVLMFFVYNTAVINRMKYSTKDNIVKYSFIPKKEVLKYWNYYHWNYKNHFKALEKIPEYLSSIGIKKTDTIISIPDQSINISLYFINHKGYTDFGYNNLKNYKSRIDFFIKNGAKYLIINDTILLENPYVKEFTHKLIGKYKNIRIYDLR